MNAPILFLRDYADFDGRILNTKKQAEHVKRAVSAYSRRWVKLDFSGITELSWEFASDFMRLAETELPEVWLVPRNYNRSAEKLVGSLLSRLKRLREQAWRDSYELFWRKPSTTTLSNINNIKQSLSI
jgi:hypothetical protein